MWHWFNTMIATNTFSENAAHILAGYGAVVTVAYFRTNPVLSTILFIIAAWLKEYAYDAYFETPRQTFLMNTTDFLGYCVGIVVGLGVTHA
jgi:hypothetical protein